MPEETLLEKALRLERVMAERHLFEGQVVTQVVLPPVGREDHLTGNLENACIRTGEYLGAQSFRYAATGDLEAKRRADDSARALRKMQTLTGTPGFFARGFKTAPEPTWDEQYFFFPREWHQAGDYRWLGDPSSDSFNGRTFGWSCYFDFAADDEGKRLAAEDMACVVSQWIENDFRLVDLDGRMTLWGNFNPHILEQDLNALQALKHLKCAHHITGDEKFYREYRRLIRDFGYADKAAVAKVLPQGSSPPWDDNLGMMAMYHLCLYEDDPQLSALYRKGLARFMIGLRDDPTPFYQFVNKVHDPDAELHPNLMTWFREYDVRRRHIQLKTRYPEDAPVIECEVELSAEQYLRAYWMGRHYGFIAEED